MESARRTAFAGSTAASAALNASRISWRLLLIRLDRGPEFGKYTFDVSGQGRGQIDPFSVNAIEGEAECVQHLTPRDRTFPAGDASEAVIDTITDDRETRMRQMDPNLMGAAG